MSFAVAGWAGEQQAPLDAVNATIRRDGFSPLPSVRRMAGLDVQAVYSRTRAGVSLGAGRATTKDPREGRELVSWLSTVGIQAGVDVLRYRTLSVFVSAGIVAGRLSLESSDARLLLLDGRTHDKAAFGFSALPLEIGTEQLIPVGKASHDEAWVLIFGVCGGWVQQLSGGWDELDATAGDLDLSGLRGRLVLGFGAASL